VTENNWVSKVHSVRKEDRDGKTSLIWDLVELDTFLLKRIEDFWRLGI
jgi:hypothetical protein